MATRLSVLKRRRKRKNQRQAAGLVSSFPVPWDDGDWFDHEPDDFDDEWECLFCCGDGWLDGYEEDPLWFEPGEMDRCPSCYGTGKRKDMTIW